VLVEVAVDIPSRDVSDRLFTYRIPPEMQNEVFVGSQVLVPFGHQDMVPAYVVAIREELRLSNDRPVPPSSITPSAGEIVEESLLSAAPAEARQLILTTQHLELAQATDNVAESPPAAQAAPPAAFVKSPDRSANKPVRIRDVGDVVESEPLFDRDYIEFLYWIAEYYCCSITQVVAAAIPVDVVQRARRMARLTLDDERLDSAPTDKNEHQIVAALRGARGRSMSLKGLRQRVHLSQTHFFSALSRLRKCQLLEVFNEATEAMSAKTVQAVVLTGVQAASKRQEQVVACVRRHNGQVPVQELLKAAGTTAGTIKRMCEQGVLAYVQQEVLRDPLVSAARRAATAEAPPQLTNRQQEVVDQLQVRMTSLFADKEAPGRDFDPWLLHGVTGSGKTEVYLRLIRKALDEGRSALMLVPEISLTPQLAERLLSRFESKVAIWHSALSPGERYDTWRRLRAGDARVLLGARSAVLPPLPDLGIIILDEEHDGSYKQSSPSPRYSAKRLAYERARRAGSLLLFGSATPDIGSFAQARQAGHLLELPERVFQQPMPESIVVDMRRELQLGNKGIFSTALKRAVHEALERDQQVIFLINRRGFASHVFCRACGYVSKCQNCSVSLVFHNTGNSWNNAAVDHDADTVSGARNNALSATETVIEEGYLSCHHCGFTKRNVIICPSCTSPFLKPFGLGTQRVEHEANIEFPGATTLRLDSDVASRKGAYEEVFEQFSQGRASILIGTQMVAKGLDIPKVTVVGVLAADVSFNLPDFRSAERGFQLLTQVSGRAGRAQHPGKVVLQTYNPELPTLKLARNHDYHNFFEEELQARKELAYPPFSQLMRVVVSGADKLQVEATCDEVVEELSLFVGDILPPDELRLLGPAPCILERLRGKYRFHFLIKNLAGEAGRRLVCDFMRPIRPRGDVTITLDIDSMDLS
jgi:primosomal protein N' (replication factor Y)